MIVDLGTMGRFPILNGYLLISKGEAAIVETGPSSVVDEYLNRASNYVDISKISIALISHVHIDHSGGAWKIIERLPNIKIAVYDRGDPSRLLEASAKTLGSILDVWGEVRPVNADNVLALGDGAAVKVGDYELELIATPGHASHSSAWYVNGERVLFPGDSMGMLFDQQIWPAAPPPFNYEMFKQSIVKLKNLHSEKICFPHFGCSTPDVFDKVDVAYRELDDVVRANCVLGDDRILNEILSLKKYQSMPVDSYFREFLMMNLRGLPGYSCRS